MGKREEQRKLKLCVLSKIKSNKHVLFGAFSDKITKNLKIAQWKCVHEYALSLGLVPNTKDWTYIRDVWWPNVRKATTEKVDNYKKTGTGGGIDKKLNDIDEEVLEIIGKESPAVRGLGVDSEDETTSTPILQLHDGTDSLNPSPTEFVSSEIQVLNTDSKREQFDEGCAKKPTHFKGNIHKRSSKQLTTSRRAEKERLQVELLKVQIYKTRLEARQLELSLGLPETSFTKNLEES